MSEILQGGMFAVMVVRVDLNDDNFESHLASQVGRSPGFFANAPIVLDIKDCDGLATADAFQKLKALFKRQHLVAIGIQNGNATQIRAAMNADLAAFPASNTRRVEPAAPAARPQPAAPQAAKPPSAEPIQPQTPMPAGKTKIITQPVRSGAQIYARGGDLIVLAAVSAGAEIIADGNIHIYGPLRGRAIAGASGDAEARIFVGKLDAELVCIAGRYLVSDEIAPEFRGQAVHVTLDDDKLSIARS